MGTEKFLITGRARESPWTKLYKPPLPLLLLLLPYRLNNLPIFPLRGSSLVRDFARGHGSSSPQMGERVVVSDSLSHVPLQLWTGHAAGQAWI